MAVNPTRPIKIRRKQAKHYFKKIKKNSIKKLGKYEGRKRYRTVKTKLGQNKYNLPVIKRIAHARDLESPQTSVGIENILRKKLFQGRKRQVSSQRVPTAPPANNNNNSSSGGGSSVGGNTITIGGGSGVDSTTRPAPKSNNREISQLSDTVKDFIREQSFQTANLSNLFSSLREIQSRAVDVKPDLPELSFFRERIKQIEQEKPAMDSLLNSTNQQLQNQWMQIKQQERDIDDLRNKPINDFKPDKRKLAQRIANLEASSSSIEPKLLRKLDKQKQKSILYQSEFDRRLNALANQDRRDKDPPAAVVDASINASIEDLKQRLNQKEISSSTFEKSIAELISEKNKLAGRVSSLESNPNLLSDLKFAPASIKQEIDDLKVQLDNQEISSGKFLNSLK
jgi:predicted nuclease with TOPRIM domain